MGNEQTDSPTSIEDMTSFIEDHARVVLSLHPEALTPDHSDFQASQQKVRTFVSDFFDHWLPTGEDRYCIAIFNMRDFKRRHDQARQSDQCDNGSNVGDPTRDFAIDVPSDKKGPCMSSKTVMLELCTSQIEYFYSPLSKEEFEDYVENGIPEDTYEDICDYSEYCEPIFDEYTSLSVNGVEVEEFNSRMEHTYDEFTQTQLVQEFPCSGEHGIMGDKWYSNSCFTCVIDEPFDINKLQIVFMRNQHADGTYRDTFSLTYEEQEFELQDSNGVSADTSYLLDEIGKAHDLYTREIDDEDQDG